MMKRFIKFTFLTDLHGDKQDKSVVEKALKFVEEFKPDLRIFGGDLWDFECLRKKASEEERSASLLEDFEHGMVFLRQYRPHIFLRGNHDERLWDLAKNGKGVAKDFAVQGIKEIEKACKGIGTRILPYNKRQGIYKVGHLKFLHGFKTGKSACRDHAVTFRNCMFGHTHAIEQIALESDDPVVARSVGCLCRLDFDYNRANLTSLRQRPGWGYGIIDKQSGHYWACQAYEIGGRWICPTSFIDL